MTKNIHIRKTKESDIPSLKSLYKTAFTEEDLFPLVLELLEDGQNTLSFTAIGDDTPLGHVVFTRCHTADNSALTLLGPLAVLPEHQHKGVGSNLVEEGFNQLRAAGAQKALVLGDPQYYCRFGFTEEGKIQPPCPIPEEWKPAWQSFALTETVSDSSGKLEVPAPWQKPELWAS